jgi:hypothetical protein
LVALPLESLGIDHNLNQEFSVSENVYPSAPTLPPTAQPPQRGTGNGFGIASMILGIVTMAGFAIPFLNYAGIGTGVVGVALGIIGLVIKFRARKAAVAGVILSGLGLILSIVLAVVYTAVFAGAVNTLNDDTVPSASAQSSNSASSSSTSFKDGVLTTPEMKIVITAHKIIPVGAAGNEYGSKPVIAFWYSMTNLTDKKLDPTTGWMFAINAIQDNDPNAVNELDVGALPDEKFLDNQMEDIKKGGTVDNAVAYELDDETTPVDLVASDDLGMTKIGKVTYKLK